MVNFASLLAVLLIYRDDLFRLAKNSALYLKDRSDEYQSDFKFVLFILLGTIPAGVLGVLFSDVLEEHLTGVKVIGGALLVTAFALWVIRNLKGAKNDGDLTIREALIIGFAQAIALIPGISRSGSTIVAGMLAGLKQDTALRFSFMLFIPVSLGGVVLESEGIMQVISSTDMLLSYAVAFFASLITSYFSLKWFMNVMRHGNLIIFSVYCAIVGTLVLVF